MLCAALRINKIFVVSCRALFESMSSLCAGGWIKWLCMLLALLILVCGALVYCTALTFITVSCKQLLSNCFETLWL